MEYGRHLHSSDLLIGTYIDDLICASVVPICELYSDSGEDRSAIEQSIHAYGLAGLPISVEKGFGFGKDTHTHVNMQTQHLLPGVLR